MQTIKIKLLKDLALSFPARSALRSLILTEKQEMTPEEFLAKIDVWLKLSVIEFGAKAASPEELL